jgi:hypothetical protein
LRVAGRPGPVRSHFSRRPAQSRDAGGVTRVISAAQSPRKAGQRRHGTRLQPVNVDLISRVPRSQSSRNCAEPGSSLRPGGKGVDQVSPRARSAVTLARRSERRYPAGTDRLKPLMVTIL